MNTRRRTWKSPLIAAVAAALMFTALPAAAHCDGLDGPVVKAASKAFETRDVNRALIWVKPEGEAEVRAAFQRAQAADARAKETARHEFYATLVRVHRAGEGEDFTGLKPAGRDLGPALPAADRALETGKIEPVLRLVDAKSRPVVEERFRTVRARRDFKPQDVAAGREYVEAYVDYIHTVEKLHDAGAGHAKAHAH